MIPAMVYGWPSAVAYMSFLLCRTFPQAGGGMLDMDDCRTKHQVVDISNHFRVSLRSRCGNESSVFGGSKNCSPKLGPSRKKPQPWSRRIAKSQSESPELSMSDMSAILNLPNHGFFYGFSQVNYSASILVTSVLFFVYGHETSPGNPPKIWMRM